MYAPRRGAVESLKRLQPVQCIVVYSRRVPKRRKDETANRGKCPPTLGAGFVDHGCQRPRSIESDFTIQS